jgi:hypothetical protein
LLVSVWVAVRPTMVWDVPGNVIVVESVPANVIEFENEAVFPFVIVRVPVEEVIVSPLILVAVAAPKVGVVNVGDVASASTVPEPVVVISPTTPALL